MRRSRGSWRLPAAEDRDALARGRRRPALESPWALRPFSSLCALPCDVRASDGDVRHQWSAACGPGAYSRAALIGDSPARGPCARQPSPKSALTCSKTGAPTDVGSEHGRLGLLPTWDSRAHHRGPHTPRTRAAGEEPPGDPGRTLWVLTPDVCGEGCGMPRVPQRTKAYPEGRAGRQQVVLGGGHGARHAEHCGTGTVRRVSRCQRRR